MMSKRKIIISERDSIATLMENDKAIEFIINRGEILLGDVFLAEVENIVPSFDAAFVNVGSDKMGFLHSSDVQGRGDLKSRLKPKQRLIVQVMKEPTGHKGPRVTTNISLPGRFLVLIPESKGTSISRKIEASSERARLKSVVNLVKPQGVGVIIRTEAQGQSDTDIQEDLEVLLERWQTIVSMADAADPPSLLYRDQDLIYRVVRELVNDDVDELVLDTPFGAQRTLQLLQNWNMDKMIKVSVYSGSTSIMVAKGVEREIRNALQTKVPLPSGGYLYIQTTEALTVVDVNSGRFTSLQSQSDTIRITNIEACREISRQLRLRNIGGMVVVDFIDMDSRADQLAVMQTFEMELLPDKAKPQIGQLTDLGLVEMTRHRQGQALSEVFSSQCGACHGSGQGSPTFNWASTTSEVPDFRLGSVRKPSRRNTTKERSERGNRGTSVRDGQFQAGAKRQGEKVHLTHETNPLLSGLDASEEVDIPTAPVGREEREGRESRESREPRGERRSRERERGEREPRPERFERGERESREARNEREPRSSAATVAVILKPEGHALFATPTWLDVSTGQGVNLPDLYDYYCGEQWTLLNATFAQTVHASFPPRSAHHWLVRLSAKATNFFTILQSMLSRYGDAEESLEEGEEDTEDADGSEEATPAKEPSSPLEHGEQETNEPTAEEASPSVLQESHLPEAVKPAVLSKLLETIQQQATQASEAPITVKAPEELQALEKNQGLPQAPALQEATTVEEPNLEALTSPAHFLPAGMSLEERDSLISDVVLPLVEAFEQATQTPTDTPVGLELPASKLGQKLMGELARLTTAERLLDDAESAEKAKDTLRYLGIMDVPLPFDTSEAEAGPVLLAPSVAPESVTTVDSSIVVDESPSSSVVDAPATAATPSVPPEVEATADVSSSEEEEKDDDEDQDEALHTEGDEGDGLTPPPLKPVKNPAKKKAVPRSKRKSKK
ncbi:MAG: Rne/Rng family ribonuclease [Vampirovibrionales bacterium]